MIYGVIHVLKLQFFNSCKKFFVLSNWGCKFLFDRRKSLRKSYPPFSKISKFIVSDLSISRKTSLSKIAALCQISQTCSELRKIAVNFGLRRGFSKLMGEHHIASCQPKRREINCAPNILGGGWVQSFFSVSMIHGAHLEFSSRAHREREREGGREERKTAIIFWACAIFVHDAPHPRLKHGGGLTSENGGAQRKENTLITVVRKTALCLACNNAHKLLFLETFYPFPLFRYFQGVLTDSSEGEGSEYSYLPEKTCCEEKMIKISIFIFLPDVLP